MSRRLYQNITAVTQTEDWWKVGMRTIHSV